MTTLQLPNQIVIDDRPDQLKPHLDALQAYERANAEALARAAIERKQLQREQAVLYVVGLAAVIGGFFLGTGVHWILFFISLVGIGLMVWAGQGAGKRLRTIENEPTPDLTGRCMAAKQLLSDLRDDLAGARRLAGKIDLRPVERSGRVARERPGRGNTTVSYLDQTWLDLGARLADGNELRIRAVERLKLRPAHYRLGSVSRKRKWKPAQRAFRQRVLLRLRLNPTVYDCAAGRLPPARSQLGRLTVLHSELRGDELRLAAEAEGDRLAPDAIFDLLRQIYAGLRRRPLA